MRHLSTPCYGRRDGCCRAGWSRRPSRTHRAFVCEFQPTISGRPRGIKFAYDGTARFGTCGQDGEAAGSSERASLSRDDETPSASRTTCPRGTSRPVRRGDLRRRRPAGLLGDRVGDGRERRGRPVPARPVPEGYSDPDNDDAVVGFAFGAPSSRHEWEQIESVLHCAERGEETGHGLSLTDDDSFEFTCNECGNVVSF